MGVMGDGASWRFGLWACARILTHPIAPSLLCRVHTQASILDTPPAEVKQLKQPQTGGGPAGGAAGVATYSSPRVNALYAVLALLPTLGREELSAVERDVHARLGALQAA